MFPSANQSKSLQDDPLNYSQLTDANHHGDYMLMHQRLPDDITRDINQHDDEDPSIGLFLSCDINMSTTNISSGFTSKYTKFSSQHSNSQMMVLSQQRKVGAVGDGNSLRNQMAIQSMRDISQYDVKKVKFVDYKENE